jgi:hypothetical protein
VLLSGKTLRHVLVIGVDGVRFDLLGPKVTPVIWGFGAAGFLDGHGITGQAQVAPLVLAALQHLVNPG